MMFPLCSLFLFFILTSVECNVTPDVSDKRSNYSGALTPMNVGTRPEYWDWREYNMVSRIKDQHDCDACWAFSAVANIESQLKIHLKKEVLLSEQFLIDCDSSGAGCGARSVLKSFAEIVSNLGGVLRYEDYKPYANKRLNCTWRGRPKPVPVTGYKRVPRDEDIMADYIYHYGPLSAGINSASMKLYDNGIDEPSNDKCLQDELDHVVLIVGFNVYVDKITKERVPYWIIKNSWGKQWGDSGFYYLVRGRNACGIANDVSFAIVT